MTVSKTIKVADYTKADGSADLAALKRVLEDALTEAEQEGDEEPRVGMPSGETYPLAAVWYMANELLKAGLR
jgi:hypothetical protein